MQHPAEWGWRSWCWDPLPLRPLRCTSSTASCTPRAHSPCLATEKSHGTATSCSLGTWHIPGAWEGVPDCACTASDTWLAGHGRCKDFLSFPVLFHSLSIDVQETRKLSSLLCYFSSLVTLVTVSKCNAHDILLLP